MRYSVVLIFRYRLCYSKPLKNPLRNGSVSPLSEFLRNYRPLRPWRNRWDSNPRTDFSVWQFSGLFPSILSGTVPCFTPGEMAASGVALSGVRRYLQRSCTAAGRDRWIRTTASGSQSPLPCASWLCLHVVDFLQEGTVDIPLINTSPIRFLQHPYHFARHLRGDGRGASNGTRTRTLSLED